MEQHQASVSDVWICHTQRRQKSEKIAINKVRSTDEGIACHFERRPLITLDRDDPSRVIRLNLGKFMEAESTLFSGCSAERHTGMVVAWHFRALRRRSRGNRTTNTETAVSTYNSNGTYDSAATILAIAPTLVTTGIGFWRILRRTDEHRKRSALSRRKFEGDYPTPPFLRNSQTRSCWISPARSTASAMARL